MLAWQRHSDIQTCFCLWRHHAVYSKENRRGGGRGGGLARVDKKTRNRQSTKWVFNYLKL